jgi:hypothetical protein
MKWYIEIENSKGQLRRFYLDHEYDTEAEAESEAENLADIAYNVGDIAWGLFSVGGSK